jgi:hypothetical protein
MIGPVRHVSGPIRLGGLDIRATATAVHTVYHDGGPVPEEPTRYGSAFAVVRNPYAGAYEPDLLPFQSKLRDLGHFLATELVQALGKDDIQAYGKGAIVGVNGELEHGHTWHEAGGWAMRGVLGQPKAIVPSTITMGSVGYRLLIPVHHIDAAYVRSHFATVDVGLQDAPRPNEILFALAAATGPRVHARLGGLSAQEIAVHDGQR